MTQEVAPTRSQRKPWLLVVLIVGFGWACLSLSKVVLPYLHLRDHMTAFEEAIWIDDDVAHAAIQKIHADWQQQDEIYVLQSIQFAKCFGIREKLFELLPKHTNQQFGNDFQAWMNWYWKKYDAPPPGYNDNIRRLYTRAHTLFTHLGEYFPKNCQSEIRQDGIVWGGKPRNKIAPIENPIFLKIEEVKGMEANELVFGLVWKGHHRAYPRVIMEEHQLVHDEIAGEKIELVYCPQNDVTIPYLAHHKGTTHRFGTSGVYDHSTPLMFDEATLSLWSPVEGKPVSGALCGQGIQLEKLETTKTTWKQWATSHPDTLTLSDLPQDD